MNLKLQTIAIMTSLVMIFNYLYFPSLIEAAANINEADDVLYFNLNEVIMIEENLYAAEPEPEKIPQTSSPEKIEEVEVEREKIHLDICEPYIEYIEEICNKYDMNPYLVEAVIYAESSGDPNSRSSCDARGLMQIMAKHHKDRMDRLGVTDLYDPYGNILVGVDLLSELMARYDNDIYCALMFYNAGYKGVDRAKRGNYSKYAIKIVDKMNELEKLNGLEK